MNYCPDCGCKMFGGFCTNCHEEVYIEEQYFDIGEAAPIAISEKASKFREQVKESKHNEVC